MLSVSFYFFRPASVRKELWASSRESAYVSLSYTESLRNTQGTLILKTSSSDQHFAHTGTEKAKDGMLPWEFESKTIVMYATFVDTNKFGKSRQVVGDCFC